MNDRRWLRKLAEIAERLDRVQSDAEGTRFDLHGNAETGRLGSIRDAMNGWPSAARYETDRSSGHTTVVDEHGMAMPAVSDPTGEAGIRSDHAAVLRGQLDGILERLERDSRSLFEAWATFSPRTLNAYEQEREQPDDPGCEVVARIRRCPDHGIGACPPKCRRGVGCYEPTVVESSTVNGNLEYPMRLGRWAYDRIRMTGKVPTDAETAAHLRGKNLRVNVEPRSA